jgi:hypothetical protein
MRVSTTREFWKPKAISRITTEEYFVVMATG